MDIEALNQALTEVGGLTRAEQPAGLDALQATFPAPPQREEWNTTFGTGSLYDAWSRTSLATAIYAANRAILRDHLRGRADFVVVEIGGGNGHLWEGLLDADQTGTIVLIDPQAEVGELVSRHLPTGVRLRHLQAPVESLGDLDPGPADALVCSLCLHHVAGWNAAERRRHGLDGPGKLEVLTRFAKWLSPTGGLGLLNEADIHCDLSLEPGSVALRNNLFDSYVWRCARAVLADIRTRVDADEELRARWLAIVHAWCFDQLRYADVPAAERDIYELDVGRWLQLLEAAGMRVREHGFTDPWHLFHRYVFEPVPTAVGPLAGEPVSG